MLPKLYRKTFKPIFQSIGIHPHVASAYRRVVSLPEYIQFIRHRGEYVVERGGGVATFHISTIGEYRTVKGIEAAEWEELDAILAALNSDDTYWDVGACVGRHSILPAQQLSEGEVVAIEAHPGNASRVETNAQLNELDNITVISKALGNESGTASLGVGGKGVDDDIGGKDHGVKIRQDRHRRTMEVPIVTGDSLARSVSPPNVVKIDVEGAEMEVIDGLTDALSHERCRTVFCEVHENLGIETDDVESQLSDLGYSVELLEDKGVRKTIRADS